MKTSLRICAAAWLCLFGIAPALQADDAPSITIMHSGSNRLKEDIKFILSLTNAAEQKQWKVIEEHLDEVFLLGIDGARPLRIDMISQNNKMETRTSFPVSKKDDFLENLNLFGID
ncbi:MAG TPA: hypothetical protein VLA12_00125, partial [Planctomycetaceae bacterium]|nr:hypothetical protein [Planctomycetaceae bacterium]